MTEIDLGPEGGTVRAGLAQRHGGRAGQTTQRLTLPRPGAAQQHHHGAAIRDRPPQGLLVAAQRGDEDQPRGGQVGGGERHRRRARLDPHRDPRGLGERSPQEEQRLRRVPGRLRTHPQHQRALLHRRDPVQRVVKGVLVPGEHQPLVTRRAGRARERERPGLAWRHVRLQRLADRGTLRARSESGPPPRERKPFLPGTGGVRDPHPNLGLRGARALGAFRQELEARIRDGPRGHGFEQQLDAARPLEGLQGIEATALLEVADQHDLAWARRAARLLLGQQFRGEGQCPPELRARPPGLQRCEATLRQRGARPRGSLVPRPEIQQRLHRAVEGHERNLVSGRHALEQGADAGAGVVPEALAAHAGAAVEQHHDAAGRIRGGIGGRGFRQEGPREAEGQHEQREAAQQQQQPVLHAVAVRDAGRAGLEEEERAEGQALAGGPPHQMVDDRPRHREGAEQEEGREEVHPPPPPRARRTNRPRRRRACRNEKRASSSGSSVRTSCNVTPRRAVTPRSSSRCCAKRRP